MPSADGAVSFRGFYGDYEARSTGSKSITVRPAYFCGMGMGFTSPQSALLKTDDDSTVHSIGLLVGPAWIDPTK